MLDAVLTVILRLFFIGILVISLPVVYHLAKEAINELKNGERNEQEQN